MINLLYIVIGVIGLFVLLQLLLRMKSWRKKGKPAPEVNGKLGKAIRKGELLLAYFYSPSCSACKVQEEHLNKLQENFKNIYRINVAKDMDAARAFGVMGTPTTVIIRKGIIESYFVGVAPYGKLEKALN